MPLRRQRLPRTNCCENRVMTKVSIIIPVYNAADYLERCIESALAQELCDFELILIDDGSSDRSVEICQKYEAQDKRVHVLYNQHGGAASARNKALAIAKGEFIAFLDADDLYHPKYLCSLYEAAINNNTQIAACSMLLGGDSAMFTSTQINPSFSVVDYKEYLYGMYTDNWRNAIAPYTKLYSRELLYSLVFPEGKRFEDAAIMFKPVYYADRIAITDAPLYYYNFTPNSASSTQKGEELLDREEALRGHIVFYKENKEKELEILSEAFYVHELVIIYHRMKKSDHPEYTERIKKALKKAYRRYHSIITDDKVKDNTIAILYPRLFDIKNKIKKDGLRKTISGFIERKTSN